MTFGQELVLAVIDTAVLGVLILLVGFWFNRFLERYKSDLEWQKAIAVGRTQAYRELWALTRRIGGTGSTTPIDPAEKRDISSALSGWYWDKGNGLYITNTTRDLLEKGWQLLGQSETSAKEIRQHYSHLRTRLKDESKVNIKQPVDASAG